MLFTAQLGAIGVKGLEPYLRLPFVHVTG